jgi:hypothetical protein
VNGLSEKERQKLILEQKHASNELKAFQLPLAKKMIPNPVRAKPGTKASWVQESHANEIPGWDFDQCLNFLCLSECAQMKLPGTKKAAQVKQGVGNQLHLKLLERQRGPACAVILCTLNLQRQIIAQSVPGVMKDPSVSPMDMQQAMELYYEVQSLVQCIQKENELLSSSEKVVSSLPQ